MEIVLSAIVTWLSVNLSLPAAYTHPRIEFVSEEHMRTVQRAGQARDGAAGHTNMSNLEAIYDDSSRTIYLHHRWTGATPVELSVLVHEMVHHLQNVAGLKYECPQARESAAYLAQDKWLALHGHSLMEEFKLDPMTMLVRTKCIY